MSGIKKDGLVEEEGLALDDVAPDPDPRVEKHKHCHRGPIRLRVSPCYRPATNGGIATLDDQVGYRWPF